MSLTLLPESVVDDGTFWTMAVNRNQCLLGKTMLVLRRPCTAVVDIEPDEWAALHGQVRRLVPAIETLFRPDQFNFAFLMNLDRQVHLHVIPRYASPRQWNGQEFTDARWGHAFGDEQVVIESPALDLLASQIRIQLLAASSE